MKRLVQNMQPYAVEELAPGEIRELEVTDDIERLVSADLLKFSEKSDSKKSTSGSKE